MTNRRACGFAAICAAAWTVQGVPVSAAASLEISSKVARFELFYSDATKAPMSEPSRWKLWKSSYDIAAVPPGEAGEQIARKLLDEAWNRYPTLVPKLPGLEREAESMARDTFTKINAVFRSTDDDIHTRLVLYVGQFDDNAYTVPPMGGRPTTVMMPIENAIIRVALAHELTHSVNIQLAHVQNSFGAPIGETVFLEGLAMRTAQQVLPGLPEAAYVEMPDDPGWLRRCYERRDPILSGIAADLDKSGAEIAKKYTFGDGNTGMHREAYCAAWILMGRILREPSSFARLARVPEGEMISAVKKALQP